MPSEDNEAVLGVLVVVYAVSLAPEGFEGNLSSAHFFDLETGTVTDTLPLPIAIG